MRELLASAAFAWMVAVVPCVGVAQDWDGLYGGLTLGYGFHDTSHSFSNLAPGLNTDPDGLLYGAFLGYAIQNGQTVFGAEVDFEGSTASGTDVNVTGATSGAKMEQNWQGSIRAVLGIAANLGPNPALYYGTVGWAFADYDFNGGPSTGFLANSYSDSLDGWTIGVGVDTRFATDWALRAEYRCTDYGKANGQLAPGFPAVSMPVSVKQHALRVGLRKDF